jgi:transcriptional regulator with XRE-family HTH domain
VSWSDQLRRYRRVHGLTQVVLAEILNVEQATISRWERGVHEPDLSVQRRLRDLICGPSFNSEEFQLKVIGRSPFAVKVANKQARNLAASLGAASLHGVSRDVLARADYRPYFSDILREQWDSARRLGFFAGDLCSVQVHTIWRPLNGFDFKYGISYWTPFRLSDGEIVLISEFREIESFEFESTPVSERFVPLPMDSVLS